LSGSIRVYYHPRYESDQDLYEGKLKILQEYLQRHDISTDLPLSNVVHIDDAAA